MNIKYSIFTLILTTIIFSGCTNSNESKVSTEIQKATSIQDPSIDTEIIEFTKKQVSKNHRVILDNITIIGKKSVPSLNGWVAYLLKLDLEFNEKSLSINEIVFTNGSVISQNLFDKNSGKSLRDSVLPDVSIKHYKKEHLIAGTHGAKNNLVIFSDPMCPFCLDVVPDVINYVNKHRNDFALYYYHYPIETIHPQSVAIIKAMIVATQNGVKDVISKVYSSKFTPKGISNQESLDEFNKALHTSITLEQINAVQVLTAYNDDLKIASDLMINGTPTLYVNGKKDPTKEAYKGLK